ncbi:hypothetical protein [Lysinibacillus sp. 2017]|uniref:hypothetical protein n=1 Tax=Lysinibacillus sp. 2017 TaxID=2169540 RepID=UPI001091F314|nr:hypothetical protein [Lysinibacillus sp. 2017]
MIPNLILSKNVQKALLITLFSLNVVNPYKSGGPMLYVFVAIVVNRFASLSEEKDAFFQLYSLPSWLEKKW